MDSFSSRQNLIVGSKDYGIFSLQALEKKGFKVSRLPFSIKILLENLLRKEDGRFVKKEDVEALARWSPKAAADKEIFFMPARVLMQDFTGVPAVVDLAAMRNALADRGGSPAKINPQVPVDLVVDHSVQVDRFGEAGAFAYNSRMEYERNRERYSFLKWGQKAFSNLRVVPPETGICHQVNLEYLAQVVFTQEGLAFPDTLIGTDSHTTMINGLGVLGWGVGGIEAEAAMLGQPSSMLIPEVVGFRLSGKLPAGATATDVVLTVTEILRKKNVVGKFVEFCGPGLDSLSLADRATVANMCPEYGATVGYFPVDSKTLEYLEMTGRPAELIALVEAYCKTQGLFRAPNSPDPEFSDVVNLDLSTVEPCLAGPKRPQDRVPLKESQKSWRSLAEKMTRAKVSVTVDGGKTELSHGSVVISAITSCTNTSNPSVMIGAGLLAKKAVEKGLSVKPWVKTSLAPGSLVVMDYLKETGLLPYLEKLKFHLVGLGCTTCLAEGTPVLLANGTARPIEQMPSAGGAVVFGPTASGKLEMDLQTEALRQGVRDCVVLTLQDGRELVCTPDHELLTAEGRWVRADKLVLERDRVVVGLEAPVDEPSSDERDYLLRAGDMIFTMDTSQQRLRSLAFARLTGHLLGDGSISVWGQGRMTVGQAVDREAVLNDIELVTGKRPAGKRYDERKWTIVLPKELTQAITALPGVRSGRRIVQVPSLPEFVLEDSCPAAMVREFLGGVFGADGTAPVLHRLSERETEAILEHPAYSQTAQPQHVGELRKVMTQILRLLDRCGVKTEGAAVREYPVRLAASSYPASKDGVPRTEVRLSLPNGLSFVERVGFRYCVDKALRGSAAAAYWRMVDRIRCQRLWMSEQLAESHQKNPRLSFSQARELAAVGLKERETVIFPHYSLLKGCDRFSRLPKPEDREFRPLHRESCGFPSPVEFLKQLGVRDWFASLSPRSTGGAKRYCVPKEAKKLPTFSLGLLSRRPAGKRQVFDLTIADLHAFTAGTIAVHNCIGNSGPLPEPVAEAVTKNKLAAVAVLSGNRNFEGRINPLVQCSYLTSPPLVVAYALAGHMDMDLTREPLGKDKEGKPVYLKDLWPSEQEIQETIKAHVKKEMFVRQYSKVTEGDDNWKFLIVPEGDLYSWDPKSTYVKKPPYFEKMPEKAPSLSDVKGARVLAVFADSVTTDHISPAGSIPKDGPAGKYLIAQGVSREDFNSFGSRRGNHEVMVRGTFANIRIKNLMLSGVEGGYAMHLPGKKQTSLYEAAEQYQKEGIPLIVLAGKEYGSGSSRDWAAKGPALQGVKAVIAESFERIHRSNLIGMGILPLQFKPGESRETFGLSGFEVYDIEGVSDLRPKKEISVRAHFEDGSKKDFKVIARLDTPVEVEYFRHGGILPYVLRQLLSS